MSTIAVPDRSPATISRSASALNLIGGAWVEGRGNTSRDICNPADTAEVLAPVREAAPEQVDEACAAAARAFPGWRATPAPDRAHVLFKFRDLLEKNVSDVAHSIVRENGKLLGEARGSLRRGLDVVEFACGIPSQLTGQTLTDISRDVDCHAIREPLGVVVGIPPFNFPALIPLWMMSIAVACGSTFLLKPAEKSPLTGTLLIELFADAGLPPSASFPRPMRCLASAPATVIVLVRWTTKSLTSPLITSATLGTTLLTVLALGTTHRYKISSFVSTTVFSALLVTLASPGTLSVTTATPLLKMVMFLSSATAALATSSKANPEPIARANMILAPV